VTFSEREACPNHVLEAMACGLPVLYKDSGATKELVGDWAGLAVTEDNFGEQVASIVAEMGRFALSRAERQFSPEDIFTRYLDEIRRVL